MSLGQSVVSVMYFLYNQCNHRQILGCCCGVIEGGIIALITLLRCMVDDNFYFVYVCVFVCVCVELDVKMDRRGCFFLF